jgi:hypothetical protein
MDFIGRKWLIEKILNKTNDHLGEKSNRTFYENLRQSRISHILIKGEAGTGKTSICKQLIDADTQERIIFNFEIDHFKNESYEIKKFSNYLNKSLMVKFNLAIESQSTLNHTLNKLKELDFDTNFLIIIDNIDENNIEFTKYLNKLEKNLPKYIKFMFTSRSAQLGFLFKYDIISIDYNYEENIINNTNLTNDIVDYVLFNLKTNKELLASLVFSTTINPGFSKDLMSLLNLLVIKSSCNFLYVKTFFNFLLSNKNLKFNLVQKIPSTINGLYLYITDYLLNSYKKMLSNSSIRDSISISWSNENQIKSLSSEQSFGDREADYDEPSQDLFHSILNLLIHRQMRPLSKIQLYERLKSKFVFLSESFFNNSFDIISNVLLKTNDLKKYSFIHSSYHDFLCDIKYSTDVHHASLEQANEILACYYFRKLLVTNFTKNDRMYYFTLNNFQQSVLACANTKSLHSSLTYLYETNVIFNPEKRLLIKENANSTVNQNKIGKCDKFKRFFKGFLCGLY